MADHKKDTMSVDEIRQYFRAFDQDDFIAGDPYRMIAECDDYALRLQLTSVARERAVKLGITKKMFDETLKEYRKNASAPCREKAAAPDASGFTGLEDRLTGGIRYGDYACSDDGICLYTGETVQKVCSHPVFPTKRYVNINTGQEYMEISFKRDGCWKRVPMVDRQMISKATAVTELASYGISVTSENARAFVTYLNTIDDLNREIIPRVETVSRLGWIEGRGFAPFIDGVAYDAAGQFGDAYDAIRSRGDFDVWLDAAWAVRRSNKIAARVFMAASVASVILKWTCNQPFMVHLWSAESGTGKTVAMMAAASVWGDPECGRYVKSMNSTTVAMEYMASFCSNLPLMLDELQTVQNRNGFDNMIYMLCEGTGRARGSREGGLREQPRWLNVIMTTGEQPITADSRAGAMNRVISLGTTGLVMPGSLSDISEAAETFRHNYGFAGEMIIRALEDESLVRMLQLKYRTAVSELKEGATGKQANYAAALIAADWLLGRVVFGDPSRDLTCDEIRSFLSTPDEVDTNEKARDWLIDFIARNRGHILRNGDDEELCRDCYGYVDNGNTYLIPDVVKQGLRDNGWDFTAFMTWCKAKGYVKTYFKKGFDKHWGIQVSKYSTIKRALCFLPSVYESAEKSTFTDVTAEAVLPF